MVNLNLILALVFYGLLFLYFIKNRDKFEIQGKLLALYKTRLGLNLMDKWSKKFPKFWGFLGIVSIIVGFIGMILIVFILLKGTYNLITIPGAEPTLVPLLPGVSIPGLPVLSFWHWIIAILVLAVVHEFAHGLYARFHGIRVKSSGFAFLGPILGAFVEPDEKQLSKRSKKTQLEVFSAGPFSNIIFGALTFLVFAFILTPALGNMYTSDGVEIVQVAEEFPAGIIGITEGEKIISVNDKEINSVKDFLSSLENLKPDDLVMIETDGGRYELNAAVNPNDEEKGYLGISISSINNPKPGKEISAGILTWIRTLFLWMFIAQFGVGLFNLLPLGIVDGGRMFLVASQYFLKDNKKAHKLFVGVTVFILLLIFINLLPWLIRLLEFIARPFI